MSDTEILNWMIFYSATVHCSRDGEDCFVEWYSSCPQSGKQTTAWHVDARKALMEAMLIERNS